VTAQAPTVKQARRSGGWGSSLSALFIHQLRRTRHIWRGVVITGLVSPTVFLLAIGAGLGSQIEAGELEALGVDAYMDYIGPGVLVVTAMQVAATESMWPTMGLLRWHGVYLGVLASPISAAQLGVGHLLWIGFRALISAASFLLVLSVAGAVQSWFAIAIIAVGVLVGWCHAGPLCALTVGLEQENVFPMLARVVIFPLFLFSGAFFPVDDMPAAIAAFAKTTPSWHGVELARHLAQGQIATIDLLHAGYLIGLSVLGFALVHRQFRKHLGK